MVSFGAVITVLANSTVSAFSLGAGFDDADLSACFPSAVCDAGAEGVDEGPGDGWAFFVPAAW